ncbi:15-hydroxyprostaglandin dehydrogenase (nad(+)) [Moniliophthora roreri]|nr:15-hydroxyprostaglandin dehydrogenase (nad(+)) [Moniliophthora roreri]
MRKVINDHNRGLINIPEAAPVTNATSPAISTIVASVLESGMMEKEWKRNLYLMH